MVPNYYPMQLPQELTNQTSENCKKPYFGPPQIFFVDFASASS